MIKYSHLSVVTNTISGDVKARVQKRSLLSPWRTTSVTEGGKRSRKERRGGKRRSSWNRALTRIVSLVSWRVSARHVYIPISRYLRTSMLALPKATWHVCLRREVRYCWALEIQGTISFGGIFLSFSRTSSLRVCPYLLLFVYCHSLYERSPGTLAIKCRPYNNVTWSKSIDRKWYIVRIIRILLEFYLNKY